MVFPNPYASLKQASVPRVAVHNPYATLSVGGSGSSPVVKVNKPTESTGFTAVGPISPSEPFATKVQTSTGGHGVVTFEISSNKIPATETRPATGHSYIKGFSIKYTEGPLAGKTVYINSTVNRDNQNPSYVTVNGVVHKTDYPRVSTSITTDGADLTPEQLEIARRDAVEILRNPAMRRVATGRDNGTANSTTINRDISLSADILIASLTDNPISGRIQPRYATKVPLMPGR